MDQDGPAHRRSIETPPSVAARAHSRSWAAFPDHALTGLSRHAPREIDDAIRGVGTAAGASSRWADSHPPSFFDRLAVAHRGLLRVGRSEPGVAAARSSRARRGPRPPGTVHYMRRAGCSTAGLRRRMPPSPSVAHLPVHEAFEGGTGAPEGGRATSASSSRGSTALASETGEWSCGAAATGRCAVARVHPPGFEQIIPPVQLTRPPLLRGQPGNDSATRPGLREPAGPTSLRAAQPKSKPCRGRAGLTGPPATRRSSASSADLTGSPPP